jgi:hypothetical protein
VNATEYGAETQLRNQGLGDNEKLFSMEYSTNGITEVVSFQIGIAYTDPDVVTLRIWVDDHSVSTNSSRVFGRIFRIIGLPGYFPGFRLISSQVDTNLLAGHPAYSLTCTYSLPDSDGLGTVNETGTVIGDRIYSIHLL